jgi:carboxyl-terminal processing protease
VRAKTVLKSLVVLAAGIGIGAAGTVMGHKRHTETLIHLAAEKNGNVLAAQAMAAREAREKPASVDFGSRAKLSWQDARVLAEVLERVKRDYVEPVSDKQLIEAAIRGMMSELDPHSAFLDPKEFESIRVSSSGEYSGVGLELAVENGQARVTNTIDDTPAALAGVRARDQLVAIDDVPVDPQQLSQVIERMRGQAGTMVKITIVREGVPEPMEFHLERQPVRVRTVKHELLEPDVGYVRIVHFSDTTDTDLRRALAKLSQENRGALKGLVLDLRNNPGGVLESAVEVSDEFLNEGLIVSASGRAADAQFAMSAKPGDLLNGAPIAVLVNGGSASASEIVAGALKDHQRAVLVGSRTFGKGSVQTVVPLSDGRAIKLTTSRYFTPSGESIHQKGIAPDIEVKPVAGDQKPQKTADEPEVRAAVAELKRRIETDIPTTAQVTR